MKRRWLVVVVVLSMAMVSVGVTSAAPESAGEETSPMTLTNRLPGPDEAWPGPTWIEGPDNTILMSFNYDGKIHIASSNDEGHSWEVFSTIQKPDQSIAGGYFTRLSETTLLLRLSQGQGHCWVRSDDNGCTWSEATPILPHRPGLYASTAPLRVMSDGRWAATFYIRTEGNDNGCMLWSDDQGQTWSEPIEFPAPTDGNKRLDECDIIELGPDNYVAAIRSDEGIEGSWDGFYLSWSNDGLDWSAPVSLGERGRMPLFYQVGDAWALCYRLYDAALGIQHNAIRFSRDGKEWSPPMIIQHGVNAAPFIVQVNGKILAFNDRYPERTRLTRHDITAKVRRLLGPASTSGIGGGQRSTAPQVFRDLLWVWGIPSITGGSEQTLATFAQASPAQRAELLGVPNMVMAGAGLPNDSSLGRKLTSDVAHLGRIVWETTPDGEGIGPPYVYEQRMAQIRQLYDEFPHIEGILLDDMSTGKIDKGFKPQHIRDIRALLPGKYEAVKTWGVVYTMSFDRPDMDDYIHELDVINLWTWHAKDVVDLEKNVAHCEQVAPDKPIVVGLYLYDYGGGRRIPLDLLQSQCETVLSLAQAGRIEGVVFLTINDDREALEWTANWIEQVGDQPLKNPQPIATNTDNREATSTMSKSLEMTGKNIRAWVNDDLTLYVVDAKGHCLWDGQHGPAPQVEIRGSDDQSRELPLASAGEFSVSPFVQEPHHGYTIRLSSFADSDVVVDLVVALDPASDELMVQVEQIGGEDVVAEIKHLYHFEKPVAAGGYMVIPHGQGYLIPADCPDALDGDGFIGSRFTLPLFGIVQGDNAMYAIVETWWDTNVAVEHYPGDKSVIDFNWKPSLGELRYPRRFLLRFAKEMDYVGMAKAYRTYAQEQGLVRTLEEKAQALPLVRHYIEAIEFRWSQWNHNQPEAILGDLRELRERGFEIDFFFPKWPNNGYDPANVGDPAHCRTVAYLLDTPVPGGWQTLADYAESARALGCPAKGFIMHGWRMDNAVERLRGALDNAENGGLKFDALYFDGYSAYGENTLSEDLGPDHPATRRQNAEAQLDCFRETARRGIVPGAEIPRFWAIPECAFFFFDGNWSRDRLTNVPTQESKAPVGEPVPLFQLVFHDCYWAHLSGGGYGGIYDWWADHNPRLYELLFACAPSYNWLPAGRTPINWEDPMTEQRLEWLRRWSAYYRAIATSEMTNHEFLSADHKQQRIEFANGVVAEFDMVANRFRIWGIPGHDGEWMTPEEL